MTKVGTPTSALSSLGIKKSQKLYDLLRHLTKDFRFIIEPKGYGSLAKKDIAKKSVIIANVEEAFETLTEIGLKQDLKSILFGCETTTVAHVLELINSNFGYYRYLKRSVIEQSRLFYVPRAKKPSLLSKEKIISRGYKLLTSENLKKSRKRFLMFAQDEAKDEHRHLRAIRRISSKLGLKFE